MSKSNVNPRMQAGLAGCVTMLVLLAIVGWEAFHWTVNRVYVEEGESAYLRYKGPLIFGSRKTASSGQFAKADGGVQEIGVLEKMLGPGRHFYCPIWWEVKTAKDFVVKPGEVGIVTSRLGENVPPGQFLVEGEIGQTKHRGILRKVYGPGRYRVHPYAYEFEVKATVTTDVGNQIKHSGWVDIPTGYVGVVTNLTENKLIGTTAGIQEAVLQPGLYLTNPKEQAIDIVLVGYHEKSLSTNLQTDQAGHLKLDASGEPTIATDDSGISFPSRDGFTIHIDFTAVWGVMPDQAANVIRNFGNLQAVETKIIVPQIESICRNQGSQFGAAALLAGETREEFQAATSQAFTIALKDKHITLLNGLVRYIYIPRQVREPIQKANLANELKLTSEQKEITAKTEGLLREAEKNVELAVETVKVETEKKVAKVKADGEKTAAETKGETGKLVAEIDRKTAELESQAQILLAESEGKARQLLAEAKAGKFKLAVAAFGSGDAYNQWVFASGLPEDIKLNLLYAGQGTFWTDLKGFTDVMLSRQVQQSPQTPARPQPGSQPQR